MSNINGETNTFIFQDIEIEQDFRGLLEQRFAEDDVFNLFGKELNFLPIDSDLNEKIDMPMVTFSIEQSRAVSPDNLELQEHIPFSVEINVYTTGESKVIKNRTLCNIIIEIMQSKGPLPHYYSFGLATRENTEVGSMIDSAYRRVIRMSGLCDNLNKIIKKY